MAVEGSEGLPVVRPRSFWLRVRRRQQRREYYASNGRASERAWSSVRMRTQHGNSSSSERSDRSSVEFSGTGIRHEEKRSRRRGGAKGREARPVADELEVNHIALELPDRPSHGSDEPRLIGRPAISPRPVQRTGDRRKSAGRSRGSVRQPPLSPLQLDQRCAPGIRAHEGARCRRLISHRRELLEAPRPSHLVASLCLRLCISNTSSSSLSFLSCSRTAL